MYIKYLLAIKLILKLWRYIMNIGDKVSYRAVKGRGRPAVGEFVRNAGIFVELRNIRNDSIVRVNPKMILGEYVFKPYNTKARMITND